MAKRKPLKEPEVKHTPPPIEWKIFIGEKYYRRMQPIPWVNQKVKITHDGR